MRETILKFAPNFDSAVSEVKEQKAAAAVNIGKILAYNSGAAFTFLQLFNALAANVTVGVTTPDFVIPIPATGATVLDEQMFFNTGLTMACTSTPTGAVAPAANAVVSYTLR